MRCTAQRSPGHLHTHSSVYIHKSKYTSIYIAAPYRLYMCVCVHGGSLDTGQSAQGRSSPMYVCVCMYTHTYSTHKYTMKEKRVLRRHRRLVPVAMVSPTWCWAHPGGGKNFRRDRAPVSAGCFIIFLPRSLSQRACEKERERELTFPYTLPHVMCVVDALLLLFLIPPTANFVPTVLCIYYIPEALQSSILHNVS